MKGPDNISEIYKALSEAAKSKGSTLKMDEATFRTKFSEDEGFRGYVQTKLSDKFKTVDELNEYAGFKKKSTDQERFDLVYGQSQSEAPLQSKEQTDAEKSTAAKLGQEGSSAKSGVSINTRTPLSGSAGGDKPDTQKEGITEWTKQAVDAELASRKTAEQKAKDSENWRKENASAIKFAENFEQMRSMALPKRKDYLKAQQGERDAAYLSTEDRDALQMNLAQAEELKRQIKEIEDSPGSFKNPDILKGLKQTQLAVSEQEIKKLETKAKLANNEQYETFFDTDTYEPIPIERTAEGLKPYREDIVKSLGMSNSPMAMEFRGKQYEELTEDQKRVVDSQFSAKYVDANSLQFFLQSSGYDLDVKKVPHAAATLAKSALDITDMMTKAMYSMDNVDADVMQNLYSAARGGMITKAEFERRVQGLNDYYQSKAEGGTITLPYALPGLLPMEEQGKPMAAYGGKKYEYTADQVARWLSKMPSYDQIVSGAQSPYQQPGKPSIFEKLSDKLKTNPVYKDSFWLTDVPQALGSSIPFMAIGLMGAPVGAPVWLTSGLSGALAQAQGQYEDAIQSGANPKEASLAYIAGLPVGATEAIQLERMLSRMAGIKGWDVVNAMIKSGSEEMLQETFQTFSEEQLAQWLYDETRGIENLEWETSGAAFISGFLMAGFTNLASRSKDLPAAVIKKVDEAYAAYKKFMGKPIPSEPATEQTSGGTEKTDTAESKTGTEAADTTTTEGDGQDVTKTVGTTETVAPVRQQEIETETIEPTYKSASEAGGVTGKGGKEVELDAEPKTKAAQDDVETKKAEKEKELKVGDEVTYKGEKTYIYKFVNDITVRLGNGEETNIKNLETHTQEAKGQPELEAALTGNEAGGEAAGAEEINPALRDVESTAKALEGKSSEKLIPLFDVLGEVQNSEFNKQQAIDVINTEIDFLPDDISNTNDKERKEQLQKRLDYLSDAKNKEKEIENLFKELENESYERLSNSNKKVSEAYHKAKAKPENTRTKQEQELVKAVEELLGQKQSDIKPEPQKVEQPKKPVAKKTNEQAFEEKYGISVNELRNTISELSKIQGLHDPIYVALEKSGLETRESIKEAKSDYLRIFFESELPSKLPAKRDKFYEDDLPEGEINVKPIEKNIAPLKDNSTQSKAASLKDITSSDPLRPVMSGVYHDKENGVLVATDAVKLVAIKDKNIKKTAIIDLKGKEIEGRFPNYTAVIPKDNPIQQEIDVKGFRSRLEGISRANKFFDTSKSVIHVRLKIGDMEYGFDAEYLNDILKIFEQNGYKKVTLQLSTPSRAIVIQEKDITGLLPPVQMDETSKYSTLIERDNTEEELQGLAEIERKIQIEAAEREVKYAKEFVDEYEKDLSDAKKTLSNAIAKVRNAKSNEELNDANAEVGIWTNEVEKIERWLNNKKLKLSNQENELKRLQNEPVIPISEVPDNDAEAVVEDIESSAESDSEVELKAAVERADEVIEAMYNQPSMIKPLKQVTANQAISIEEIADKRKINPKDLAVLYSSLIRNLPVIDEDSMTDDEMIAFEKEGIPNGLPKDDIPPQVRKRVENLLDAGYMGIDTRDVFYITPKGKELIDAVTARLETRKGVKQGVDLFPNDAAIEEVNQKPQSPEAETPLKESRGNRIGNLAQKALNRLRMAFPNINVKVLEGKDFDDAVEEAQKPKFMRRRIVGGNSGYVGYSMSKRAMVAYEEGKLPYSKLPAWAKRMVDAGMATTTEWHHTSSYGNETSFYSVQQFFELLSATQKEKLGTENIETFQEVPKQFIKEMDAIAKVKLKEFNNVKAIRQKLINAAQKRLDEFNARFPTFRRAENIPKHGIVSISEMEGKYGWFNSSGKSYNLPEYHSGIDYQTSENEEKAKQLKQELNDAKNKPLYYIELKKIGFNDNEISQLYNYGIITSEIMPASFYEIAKRNKEIITKQIGELQKLPKINEEFNPSFDASLDNYLTDEEKQKRKERHSYISDMGDSYGSSYERKIAHEQVDYEYEVVARERYNTAKEKYLKSDEVKRQSKKHDADREEASKILNNIKNLFDEGLMQEDGSDYNKSPLFNRNKSNILGFYDEHTGEVVLNKDGFDEGVALEEYGHLWLHLLQITKPDFYKTGIKLAKQHPNFDTLSTDPDYEHIWGDEDSLANEVLAKLISGKAAKNLTPSFEEKVRLWLKKMWEAIREILYKSGLVKSNTMNINTLTVDKLVEVAADELLSTTPITEITSKQLADAQVGSLYVGQTIKSGLMKTVRRSGAALKIQKGLQRLYLSDTYMKANMGAGNDLFNMKQHHNARLQYRLAAFEQADYAYRSAMSKYKKNHTQQEVAEASLAVQRYYTGDALLTDVPEILQPSVKVMAELKDGLSKTYQKMRIAYGDDIIFGINENLEHYLDMNFQGTEAIEKRMKAINQRLRKELDRISKLSGEELENEYLKIRDDIDNLTAKVKEQVLRNINAAIKLKEWDIMKSKVPELTAMLYDLKKKLDAGVGSITPVKKPRKKMTQEEKDLNAEIKAMREKLKDIEERELTDYEQDLTEQIQFVLDALETEGQRPMTEVEFNRYVQSWMRKKYRIEHKLEVEQRNNLQVVEVKFNRTPDGKFDLELMHSNGTTTSFDNIPYRDVELLFGKPAGEKMLLTEEGYYKMPSPEILTNNKLFARMMANEGKYMHRSYQMFDREDWPHVWREVLGEQVVRDAMTFLREKLESSVIQSVNVNKGSEGYFISYVNEYGRESKKMKYKSLDGLTEANNWVLSDADITLMKKKLETSDSIEHRLRKPTPPQSNIRFLVTDDEVMNALTIIVTPKNFGQVVAGGKIAGFDSGIFKERKDIAPEIRAVMGEYMDPRVNMMKTVTKIAQALKQAEFMMDVLEGGGPWVSKTQTPSHTVEVSRSKYFTLPANEKWYITPEAERMINGIEKDYSGNIYIALMGAAKLGHTVFYPESQSRNFLGAALNNLTTGNYNLHYVPMAIKVASQGMYGSEKAGVAMSPILAAAAMLGKGKFGYNPNSTEFKDLYLRVTKAGILNESIDYNIAKSQRTALTGSKFRATYNKITDPAIKAYALADNTFKIVQWLSEIKTLSKAYPDKTQEEIDLMAGDIVRRLQPTYSRLPAWVRKWSTELPIGSFVSWPTAMILTRAEMIKQIHDELMSENPVLVKKGWQRLAALALMTSLTPALAMAARYAFDWDDDDDEAVASLSPDFAKNNIRLYLSPDKVNIKFIDLTYVDPASMFYRPIVAFMREPDNWRKALAAGKGLANPYISMDIFVSSVFEAFSGKDAYNMDIWYKSDTGLEKTYKMAGHVLESLTPQIITTGARISEAVKNEMNPGRKELQNSVRQYELDAELVNLSLGVKVRPLDMQKSAATQINYKYGLFTETATHYRKDKEGAYTDYDYSNKKARGYFKEVIESAQSLKQLYLSNGMTGEQADAEIARILKEKEVAKYLRDDIKEGRIPVLSEDKKSDKKFQSE